MPYPKTPCPFTPARLSELYWREAKSRSAIGRLVGVSSAIVRGWLTDAKITLRSRSEVIKAEYVTHGSAKRKAVSATALRINAELAATRSADHLHNKATARKISRVRLAQAEARRKELYTVVSCDYCGSAVRRLKSRVKERNFCDRKHMMLYRHSHKRIEQGRRLCSEPGCGKPHCAKGFCKMHYYQAARAEQAHGK